MIAVIGQDAQNLCKYLEENGISTAAYPGEQVPSLTALLLNQPDITDIVLMEGQEKSWSMGHILAAAKQLQGKGRMIFLGDHIKMPALITSAQDKDALLQILLKPVKSSASGSTGGSEVHRFLRRVSTEASAPVLREADIRPLAIPPGRILFLGVVGSQHRIGCTTQAVGLWHYCKRLGFDPAIVAGQEQIAEIAATMHSQEISGGYKIEGIPFVTDTALTYDCYILDIGPGSVQEVLSATDCLVLVAGSKPWELQHTAAALRSAKGKDMLILLSFSTQSDGEVLRPLFGHQAVAVLPYMPQIWQPSLAAMTIYDAVLRPVLERILARDEPQLDEDLQLMKGE